MKKALKITGAIALRPPGFAGFRTEASTVCTTDATRFWSAPETESLR